MDEVHVSSSKLRLSEFYDVYEKAPASQNFLANADSFEYAFTLSCSLNDSFSRNEPFRSGKHKQLHELHEDGYRNTPQAPKKSEEQPCPSCLHSAGTMHTTETCKAGLQGRPHREECISTSGLLYPTIPSTYKGCKIGLDMSCTTPSDVHDLANTTHWALSKPCDSLLSSQGTALKTAERASAICHSADQKVLKEAFRCHVTKQRSIARAWREQRTGSDQLSSRGALVSWGNLRARGAAVVDVGLRTCRSAHR